MPRAEALVSNHKKFMKNVKKKGVKKGKKEDPIILDCYVYV